MTVSPTYNTITYTANGTTTDFPWTYDYDPTYGALVVKNTTDDITYVEGTDYTIVNKTVIFTTAPANGKSIELSRNTYRGQEVTFIEGEDFPAQDYETSLDRLFMIEQEQDKALADETTARIAADVVLQENIDAEADARSAADTVLQGNIDDEVSRAKGVEGTLSNLTTTAKSNLVAAINEVDAHADSISSTISGYGDIVTHDVDEFATASQGAKADTAVQPSSLATVATSGSYNDLSNKPTIGNATITVKQGDTTKGTFTVNQTSNATISLDEGGSTAADAIYLKNQTISFAAGIGAGYADVSSAVEAGVGYCPVVYLYSTDTTIDCQSTYDVTNKRVCLLTTDTASSKTVSADICLIPTTSSESWVTGITTGLLREAQSFISLYDKVTSLSSASTDSQVPSAKCVYDELADKVNIVGTDDITIKKSDAGVKFQKADGTPVAEVKGSVSGANSGIVDIDVHKQTSGSSAFARFQIAYNSQGAYSLAFWGRNTDSGDTNVCLSSATTSTTNTDLACKGWINNYFVSKLAISTSLSSSSTDDEVPSAKCVYDMIGDIETLLAAI